MQRLYIEEGTAIAQANFIFQCWWIVPPRNIAFIVSTEGGMDIEEVAHKTPDKILTVHVDPAAGYHALTSGRRIAAALKLRRRSGQAMRDKMIAVACTRPLSRRT